MDIHSKNKKNLEDQISDSQKNLYELKKRNQVNTISSQAASEKDKDKNKEEADVNIDELLFDLKKDIIKVHGSTNK